MFSLRSQVVFTDGVTGGQSLSNAVQQLANKGVIVFVVGVGRNIDVGLLAQLTRRADLVYSATDFLDLYIKAGFVARQICQHARKYIVKTGAINTTIIIITITIIITIKSPLLPSP
jgi:hypothetical protein